MNMGAGIPNSRLMWPVLYPLSHLKGRSRGKRGKRRDEGGHTLMSLLKENQFHHKDANVAS